MRVHLVVTEAEAEAEVEAEALWLSVLLCGTLCNKEIQELSESTQRIHRVAQSCVEVGLEFSLRTWDPQTPQGG